MLNRLIAIFAIILAVIGYAVYQKNTLEDQLVPSSKSAEAVLTRLPEGAFETLDGKAYPTEAAWPAKLVIVHYWGTWCGPCEAELPELLGLIKRFEGNAEVKFLLVAVNDEVRKVEKHIKALPISKDSRITWLLDNNGVHREAFGTTRVPETFVFASDKMTLRKYVGPQEWNKSMFFQQFDEFLQISSSKL